MWQKSRNSEFIAPPEKEVTGEHVILRRNITPVEATEEFPAHYEYEEWQMTASQYEVYQNFETLINEQSDALIELAELAAEQDDALVELAGLVM